MTPLYSLTICAVCQTNPASEPCSGCGLIVCPFCSQEDALGKQAFCVECINSMELDKDWPTMEDQAEAN